ncbi:MAG: DUF3302 domain-containing protein [Anderseniella sp.]
MEGLTIFALIVLIILLLAVVGIWIFLAIWPGKIARSRKHSRADAVAVCGYWGGITLGILMPLAFVWAYTENNSDPAGEAEGAVK